MSYGRYETWKVVYHLPPHLQNNGAMGVALVEAMDRSQAMYIFQTQYAGQFHTIASVERLLG